MCGMYILPAARENRPHVIGPIYCADPELVVLQPVRALGLGETEGETAMLRKSYTDQEQGK